MRRSKLTRRPMLRRVPLGSNPFDPMPCGADGVRDAAKEATLPQLIAARAKVMKGRAKKFGFNVFNLDHGIDDELKRRFEKRFAQPKPLTRAEIASWGKAIGPDRVKSKIEAKAQAQRDDAKVRRFERKDATNVETV